MLRRLLACLALLTGLAAIGSPVNPAMAETLTGQVGASVMADQAEAGQECPCTSRSASAAETEKCAKRNSAPRKTIRVYIPTVQFGADRAYE